MLIESISQSFIFCFRAFEERLAALQGCSKAPLSKWNDEKGRLRVWAANIGAHQTGQSSLDFRLRDAPHIHRKILQLIDDLIETIHEVQEIHEIILKPESEQSDEHESISLHGTDSSGYDEDPESEMDQLYRSVVNIIDCLFQMSMLVRKPARHKVSIDLQFKSSFGPYDRDHVFEKFKVADIEIAERLGRANTRRRAHLKHREQRRLKFGKGMDEAQDESMLSETVATELAKLDIGQEESESISGHSTTSYASSLQSGTSLTIPAPPEESAEGKPFECPFCFYIIKIQGSRSWTKHVFQDLLPYVCPFSDCPAPEKLYDSSHDWYRHLQVSHASVINRRVCPLCKSVVVSAAQFKRHLARHLEDLALFVLPVKDEVTDDDDQRSSRAETEGSSEHKQQYPAIEKESADQILK
ncbi:MAG: hypothetical protein LQ338_007209, partial [Usnochroma carphineum]